MHFRMDVTVSIGAQNLLTVLQGPSNVMMPSFDHIDDISMTTCDHIAWVWPIGCVVYKYKAGITEVNGRCDYLSASRHRCVKI